jgi:hypothetical protein
MAGLKATTFTLPNGHTVEYQPVDLGAQNDAYILEVKDGNVVVLRTCSCNGVSRDCPPGKSPSCDCTKNPPVLSCI